MTPSAADTAFNPISSRCLRYKLNGCSLAFLNPEAILGRRENKACISHSLGSFRVRTDFETMRVIGGGDLELDFCALLDPYRGWIVLVLFSADFDDLGTPSRSGRLILRPGNGAAGERERRNHKQ